MKALRSLGFFINTLLGYLGLPLLGWGINHLQGFFSSLQRSSYAALIVILGFAVGYQAYDAPEGIRGGRGQKGKRLQRQTVIRIVITLGLFAVLAFLPFADRRNIGTLNDSEILRWLGLALFVLGMGLIYWSGVLLGRMYSPDVTIQDRHRLVTNGIYQNIRHPRYLGAELTGLGLALLFRSWVGLLINPVLLGLLLWRIKDEETTMHREFGELWEAYCQRSWRLIPHVW
ncbi:MAG: methyltransferase family protein [Anaerolineae bacterium]